MAKKYSKYNSNYILNQEHKRTNKGVITSRDWTTIGGIERLERGKKPIYGNGNFLFTVRNIATNPTRHVVSKFVGSYTYDDVKNSKPQNNLTELNLFTNDIRDFAYYGSATDLVHSTIQNIIKTFPSRITTKSERILDIMEFNDDDNILSVNDVVDKDINDIEVDVFDFKKPIDTDDSENYIYLLNNPFQIDLHHEDIRLDEYLKPYRFLTYYFNNFVVSNNGSDFHNIKAYYVTLDYNNIDRELNYPLQRFNCVFNGCKVANIKIVAENLTEYNIEGYLFDGNIKWGTKDKNLIIQPNNDIIEEYFSNLKGFEKILLTRATKPLYYCCLATPVIENDIMVVVNRYYQFPQQDGFIDIDSPQFTSYLNQLFDIANIWDQLYCDNLYQRMTHEAIKNYDWTFTKDYENGDEEEFIDGGVRIEKLLKIYGRLFDDIKHHIDGIKFTINNTYDGYRNMPTAQLTDNLEESGWHINTTIPVLNVINEEGEDISKEFADITLNDCDVNWFNNCNKDKFDFTQCNTNFMRKLLLNSNYIFRSKGTKKSIEMIMGMFGLGVENNDFEIKENYYKVKPKEFPTEVESNFQDVIDCFEGLVTEDAPDGGINVKTKQFLKDGVKTDYIVPFVRVDSNNYDLYFQSNGGWGKYSTDEKVYDYTETVSYLRIKYNISELFEIAPIKLKKGDLFYVTDIQDFNVHFTETPISRYFIVDDVNLTYCAQGWKNVDMNDETYGKQIQYMENIIVTNLGNNPHVGYGRYDMGNYYKTHMSEPFKFAKENHTTYYGKDEIFETEKERNAKIEEFNFDIEDIYSNEKVFIINKEKEYQEYYLNSKIVKIQNKRDNLYFKEYFKEVILPYIMQVIPSTTILILENYGYE